MATDVLASRPAAGLGGPFFRSEMYRVVIRLEKVRENLSYLIGVRPTDAEVVRWLCGLGFVPAVDGNAWLGSADSIQRLNSSEVVRAERLDASYDCYPDLIPAPRESLHFSLRP